MIPERRETNKVSNTVVSVHCLEKSPDNSKVERIHHDHINSIRNVKGNPLGKRTVILDGNMDLNRVMKGTKKY